MLNENKLQSVCLLILTFIATGVALAWLKPVIIPFILAIFLVLILTPLINAQKKYLRFPHTLAVLISIIIGAVFIFFIGMLISASITQMINNIDFYQTKISAFSSHIVNMITIEKFGVNLKDAISPLLQDIGENVGNIILATFNAIIGLFSRSILVFIFVLFLLMSKRKNTNLNITPSFIEGEKRIKTFVITKIIISSATGLLVGLVLTLLGIDLALAFGLMAFILNFIPNVGSIIATLLPIPIILLTPEISETTAIIAIVIPGIIQFAIGNILEPKIMGDSLDLHPVTILLALIFWGIIWGVVGMFLAVPMTVILKIILTNIAYTSNVATRL